MYFCKLVRFSSEEESLYSFYTLCTAILQEDTQHMIYALNEPRVPNKFVTKFLKTNY